MEESKSDESWLPALLTVLAATAYFGAYSALVERHDALWSGPYARYKHGGEFARLLFFPAHSLDEVIRPGTWGAPARSGK
jgi:hypothetical protein